MGNGNKGSRKRGQVLRTQKVKNNQRGREQRSSTTNQSFLLFYLKREEFHCVPRYAVSFDHRHSRNRDLKLAFFPFFGKCPRFRNETFFYGFGRVTSIESIDNYLVKIQKNFTWFTSHARTQFFVVLCSNEENKTDPVESSKNHSFQIHWKNTARGFKEYKKFSSSVNMLHYKDEGTKYCFRIERAWPESRPGKSFMRNKK